MPSAVVRSLAGALAELGVAVGAVHADVDAGHPDGLTGGVQPREVAELAQGHQGGDLAHAVLGHQRLAAGLAVRERAQVPLEFGELRVEQVDDLERDTDALARVKRELQGGEELTAGQGAQFIGRAGDTVVIQRRADPLGPAGALGDQRVAQLMVVALAVCTSVYTMGLDAPSRLLAPHGNAPFPASF